MNEGNLNKQALPTAFIETDEIAVDNWASLNENAVQTSASASLVSPEPFLVGIPLAAGMSSYAGTGNITRWNTGLSLLDIAAVVKEGAHAEVMIYSDFKLDQASGAIVISDSVSTHVGLENVGVLEKEIESLKIEIQNYNESFDAINLHYQKLSKLKNRMYSGGMAVIGLLYFLSITLF